MIANRHLPNDTGVVTTSPRFHIRVGIEPAVLPETPRVAASRRRFRERATTPTGCASRAPGLAERSAGNREPLHRHSYGGQEPTRAPGALVEGAT